MQQCHVRTEHRFSIPVSKSRKLRVFIIRIICISILPCNRYYISFWLVIFNQLMMSTRIYNVTHVQSYILNSCPKRIAHSDILQSLVIIISPLITKPKYIIFLNKNVKNLR